MIKTVQNILDYIAKTKRKPFQCKINNVWNYKNNTIILERMKKTSVSIKSQYPNREELFLQDPKSDLYVLVKQKIYPLHKSFLQDVHFFQSPTIAQGKVHVLAQDIDASWLEAILAYFYGKTFQYERDWELYTIVKTLKFLGVTGLTNKIYADMKNNFDQYGFFLLLQIAHSFKLNWLRQMCDQQLSLMNFEQLNYNRYDLFQVQRQVLETVLKFHELLRVNRNIVGQNGKNLKRIVTQYCKANKIDLSEVQIILLSDQQTLDEIKQQEPDEEITRKRNNSEPQYYKGKQEQQKISRKMFTQPDLQNLDREGQRIQADSKHQLYKLRILNCEMNSEGNKMLGEINKAKEEISDQKRERRNSDIEVIDDRFKKLEKMCKQQDQKFLNLKKEMQKFGTTENSKSKQKQKSRTSSPSLSGQKSTQGIKPKQKRHEGVLSEIPKLSKE